MKRDYVEELKVILTSNISVLEKRNKILQYHENDIAKIIDILEPVQKEKLFDILGEANVAKILSYVNNIDDVVYSLPANKIAKIIDKMDVDDAIDILENLEEDKRHEIVVLMDNDQRQKINNIRQYGNDCIGSEITDNYIAISKTDTVKQAMDLVIAQAKKKDNASTIYVIDENNKFYGVMDLRDLIACKETTNLEGIIQKNYPYFYANEEIDKCLSKFKEYQLNSYPILNNDNELVGVITMDDVLATLNDEYNDDYAKLAGLTQKEKPNDTVLDSVKKRLPWLIILLILGLFQSFAMTAFERIVAALPVIVFFQTIVLSMSGDSATQSLAVTIRKLSDEENGRKKIIQTAFKELRTGFLNGLSLAIIAFIIVFVFMFLTKQSVSSDYYNVQDAIKASGIVSVALMISMTISSCVGTIVPFLFLKLKIDPAVASGPFITTISDITSLLIFYGLAYFMFMVL